MIGLISGLLLIGQAWLLAKVINAVVFNQADLAAVMPWLWTMLAIFLGRALLTWCAEQAAFQAALQVKLAVRQQLYQHLQQLGPAWLTGERTGELLTSLSDGVEALEAYYARYLPSMTLVVLIPLALLVFVTANDWLSGVILVVTAPLIPVFMILIGKGTEQRNQQQWQKLTRMSAYFLDLLQGMTTLKLFNASRREAHMVANMSEQYRHSTMSVLRVAFLSSLTLEFFATVSVAVLAVLVGFRLFWGELDFLHGFFVLLLAPEFYLPLRTMGTQYHARMQAIAAAERIIAILNITPNSTHPRVNTAYELKSNFTLHLQDLSFTYPDGRQGLDRVNLAIYPGETLALVGSSGAGKTTLVNLLLGFLSPTSGQILINDTPLSAIPAATWRQQLAWLPQKPQLFPNTVLENIRLGQPHANLEIVELAAHQAQAHGFILDLDQGYNTLIGEAGQGLSGGQTQRIALARAFLKNAPLVILDEATAHLDAKSEALIQTAIKRLAQERTVVMIAHRLSTIREADRIAVMEQGRIVAIGTHTRLQQSSVPYQQMLAAYANEDT